MKVRFYKVTTTNGHLTKDVIIPSCNIATVKSEFSNISSIISFKCILLSPFLTATWIALLSPTSFEYSEKIGTVAGLVVLT